MLIEYNTEKFIHERDKFVKGLKNYKKLPLSENGTLNDSGIKKAVSRAFPDITFRTMKRKPQSNKETKDMPDELCDSGFLAKIKEWLSSDDNFNFETWHKEACELVTDFLKKYYEDASCTYGKAQKLVNMTCKHLYRLDNADSYENKFKQCHMPLDSFILEWFYREVASSYNQGKKQKDKITKGKIGSWSGLKNPQEETFKENDKTYYSYWFYQKEIKEFFKDKGISPLQAEYIIWPEIQLHIATEGFIFAMKDEYEDDESKNKIKEKSIEEKLNIVCSLIEKRNNLLHYFWPK